MMEKNLIKSQSTIATCKIVKKFGVDIEVSNSQVRGIFTIKNYRKYPFYEEVDVDFKGEINVVWNRKKDWYDSTICKKQLADGQKVSKVKLNRFLRKGLISTVKTHMNYYDVFIRNYIDIKKINWL